MKKRKKTRVKSKGLQSKLKNLSVEGRLAQSNQMLRTLRIWFRTDMLPGRHIVVEVPEYFWMVLENVDAYLSFESRRNH